MRVEKRGNLSKSLKYHKSQGDQKIKIQHGHYINPEMIILPGSMIQTTKALLKNKRI